MTDMMSDVTRRDFNFDASCLFKQMPLSYYLKAFRDTAEFLTLRYLTFRGVFKEIRKQVTPIPFQKVCAC